MSKPPVSTVPPQPVMVQLADLDLPGSPQTRAKLNKKVAQEYAAAMRRGDAFPPVEVIRVNGVLLVFDGQHRCEAAKLCGQEQILAVVREGTMEDAVRLALQANTIHGLRRTNADKRQAVKLALGTEGVKSDHLIAELCGVSQTMVSGQRAQLKESFSSASRVGRDAKTRRAPKRKASPEPGSIAEFDLDDWIKRDGADYVVAVSSAAARFQNRYAEIIATHAAAASTDPGKGKAQIDRQIALAIVEELTGIPRPKRP